MLCYDRRMKSLVLAATALLLAGCAASRFETPDLQIVGVEMQQADLFQQRFKVRLRVQNPNDRALPVQGITAKMDVGGEQFAQGVSGESFTVPAFGEAEFDMLLNANVAGAVIRLLAAMRDSKDAAPSLDYRVYGKLSLSSGLIRSIPFEEKGRFSPDDLR